MFGTEPLKAAHRTAIRRLNHISELIDVIKNDAEQHDEELRQALAKQNLPPDVQRMVRSEFQSIRDRRTQLLAALRTAQNAADMIQLITGNTSHLIADVQRL
jgi:hypothetical protein